MPPAQPIPHSARRRNRNTGAARRALRRVVSIASAVLLTGTILAPSPAHADVGSHITYETITSHDGTELKAKVITPTGVEGPHPLLVMPAAWGTPHLLYVGAGKKLAEESGYQVISYTSRGFWDSGGGVEVAGPEDRADASAVIDWALDNTEADPERIGMSGISYGGGISLLTAAEDERVRAVGSLSGWADLVPSLYPNETIDQQSAEMLLLTANLTGNPGETLQEVEAAYRQGDIQPALDMAPDRSAATKVDQINANGAAVMIAHGWNDGIFPVGHITDFYEELSGPKRLMIAPGDHATQELFGAAGLPNEVWESLAEWMDHHLKGEENGIDTEDPVHLKPNNGRGDWTSHPDWPSAVETTEQYYLGEPTADRPTRPSNGPMEADPATDWEYDFRAGIGTLARSGTVMLSGALQQFFDVPTGVSLPLVDRRRAAVWTGPEYPDGARVAGTPEATFTFTPTAEEQSVFVYLYAINRHGTGSLLSHAPLTLRDAEPGEPVTVDTALTPVVWDVPAGHRLAVVVDSKDLRYTSESRIGETVTVSSPEETPTRITIPFA